MPPDPITPADVHLDHVLRQLARAEDPLVAKWAKRLLKHGERAESSLPERPTKPQGKKKM